MCEAIYQTSRGQRFTSYEDYILRLLELEQQGWYDVPKDKEE